MAIFERFAKKFFVIENMEKVLFALFEFRQIEIESECSVERHLMIWINHFHR